eukprot:5173660-Amphidinium_carterae.1
MGCCAMSNKCLPHASTNVRKNAHCSFSWLSNPQAYFAQRHLTGELDSARVVSGAASYAVKIAR